MSDFELLEELVLDLDLELHQVDEILSRENTIFDEEYIYDLDLSRLGITELPDLIGEFVALKSVDLSHNQISQLSPYLLDIPELEKIYLNDNPIHQIPDFLIPISDKISIEHHKLKRTQSNNPEFKKHYISVNSINEKKQVESMLEVFRSRRCCKLSGRLNDNYCAICGRVVQSEWKVKS